MSSIAFVIPVFKHSQLFAEAVHSVVSACEFSKLNAPIIVVDDGCPFIATHIGGLALREVVANFHYVRGVNQGLSAARNRGITYILDKLPAVEAIFFLDADNLVEPHSCISMTEALARHPEADWFYPDIRMFGLDWLSSYAGDYLPLIEALSNICEAGSLVRSRIFKRGSRFDETMKFGYEDWDFWLSISETGARGKHWPSLGFRYRKRAESMLADSHRDDSEIRNYMRRKHPWINHPKTLLALEHDGLQRYAILLADKSLVFFASDPSKLGEGMSAVAYGKLFLSSAIEPNRFHAGSFLVVTTSSTLDQLDKAGVLTWTFFDLEQRTREGRIATTSLVRAQNGLLEPSSENDQLDLGAHLLMSTNVLLKDIVLDNYDSYVRSIVSSAPQPKVSARSIGIPTDSVSFAIGTAPHQFLSLCLDLRASDQGFLHEWPGTGTYSGTPDRSTVYRTICQNLSVRGLMPLVSGNEINVAFLLPVLEFGGVERVAVAVARSLKESGMKCHAVLIGIKPVNWAEDVRLAFDSIVFIDLPNFNDWSGPNYEGTVLSGWSVTGDHAALLGYLAPFDAVLSCHGSEVFGIFGRLRRMGIITIAHVHVNDVTAQGRIFGHPQAALAYEHAIDLVLACSDQIGAQMVGRGLPPEKLIIVPNSSGVDEYQLRTVDWSAHRRARAGSHSGLNVLFMGRFDHQKGIDRLEQLLENDWKDSGVQFRLVGKPVVDGFDVKSIRGVRVEPAVYEPDRLINLLLWADVLVLPSRYEGLPLAVIEALIAGVIPVAADCGALREVMTDGVNGFIVPQQDCAKHMRDLIIDLVANRAKRLEMAEAAISSTHDRCWKTSTKELYRRLSAAVDVQRRKLSCYTLSS